LATLCSEAKIWRVWWEKEEVRLDGREVKPGDELDQMMIGDGGCFCFCCLFLLARLLRSPVGTLRRATATEPPLERSTSRARFRRRRRRQLRRLVNHAGHSEMATCKATLVPLPFSAMIKRSPCEMRCFCTVRN